MGLVFPLERYGNLPGTCIGASDLEGAEDQLNDLYPGEDRTPEKAAVCPMQGHRLLHPLFFAHIKGLQWPSRKHTVRSHVEDGSVGEGTWEGRLWVSPWGAGDCRLGPDEFFPVSLPLEFRMIQDK